MITAVCYRNMANLYLFVNLLRAVSINLRPWWNWKDSVMTVWPENIDTSIGIDCYNISAKKDWISYAIGNTFISIAHDPERLHMALLCVYMPLMKGWKT